MENNKIKQQIKQELNTWLDDNDNQDNTTINQEDTINRNIKYLTDIIAVYKLNYGGIRNKREIIKEINRLKKQIINKTNKIDKIDRLDKPDKIDNNTETAIKTLEWVLNKDNDDRQKDKDRVYYTSTIDTLIYK